MKLGELNVELWLFILHSGEWWTGTELDRHFNFKPGTAWERLHNMARHGTLEKRQVQGTRSVKYAVTSTCSVPVGIPIGKVQIRQLADERERSL